MTNKFLIGCIAIETKMLDLMVIQRMQKVVEAQSKTSLTLRK